jgi:hypothetical protein
MRNPAIAPAERGRLSWAKNWTFSRAGEAGLRPLAIQMSDPLAANWSDISRKKKPSKGKWRDQGDLKH